MSDAKAEPKRGRTHNAAGARQAILNAAEEIFAEHGFDGARVDAIAEAAGYNKGLIFNYFEDKLGLYAEVVRRADQQMGGLQAQLLAALGDESTVSSPVHFKAFLKTALNAYFDYLVEHPRFMHIFLWEMAEGWQTYAKIIAHGEMEDIARIMPLLHKLQRAGLLRSGFDPIIQVTMAVYFCHYYIGTIPLFQMLLPSGDFSPIAANGREFVIDFIIHGLMGDSAGTMP